MIATLPDGSTEILFDDFDVGKIITEKMGDDIGRVVNNCIDIVNSYDDMVDKMYKEQEKLEDAYQNQLSDIALEIDEIVRIELEPTKRRLNRSSLREKLTDLSSRIWKNL